MNFRVSISDDLFQFFASVPATSAFDAAMKALRDPSFSPVRTRDHLVIVSAVDDPAEVLSSFRVTPTGGLIVEEPEEETPAAAVSSPRTV